MSHIKRRDTKPEIFFRKAIWKNGVRGYRIDVNLPGKPDIYFPKYHVAVFVDGCFWHKCPICYVEPKSHREYWLPKLDKNVEHDRLCNKQLSELGITVIRYWEHDIEKKLEATILDFIELFTQLKKDPNKKNKIMRQCLTRIIKKKRSYLTG